MLNICGKYDVLYNDISVGDLFVRENGLKFLFDCTCKIVENDVFRLACLTESQVVSIGILVPENGEMKLKKSFSHSDLTRLSLKNIKHFFILPASQELPVFTPSQKIEKTVDENVFWKREDHPEHLFPDDDISRALLDTRGALIAEDDGITFLAVPVSSREPFPAMPIFCFGESQTIDEHEYIIFKIKNGSLC